VGFLDHELAMSIEQPLKIADLCRVTDTLVMAKRMHPGQRNSLDALCKRYAIDNSHRELHGALLDAEILADVYLRMTGGQAVLSLESESGDSGTMAAVEVRRVPKGRWRLKVVQASAQELEAHEARLDSMGEKCVWRH
jgi:DNA polymerase-3 subunit epsilon